jgi:hypothetical protein
MWGVRKVKKLGAKGKAGDEAHVEKSSGSRR